MILHSYYSYHYGTLSPKEVIEQVEGNGVHLAVLADINSTSGSLYYALQAQRKGITPVLGIDFRDGNELKYIAIAQNNRGFEAINRYLSSILAKQVTLEDRAPMWENVWVIYPLKIAPHKLNENEFVGIRHSELVAYNLQYKNQWPSEKCVALHFATFRNKRDFNTHRLLRAIGKNTLLSMLPAEEQGSVYDVYCPPQQLYKWYESYSFLLRNWNSLLAQCSVTFEFNNGPQNLKVFGNTKAEDLHRLRQLAEEGLHYRFGENISDEVQKRLDKEISVITQCNYVPYFLVNHSIVNYARSKGYFYVGRGSGANSLVAYLLRITNVDPIELDLYFERFINPSRKSPPDFDIDFSWRDREDVTRYIFDTFPNTALLGAFVTFQKRSVIREIGKVLGLPADEIKTIQQTRNPNHLDQLSQLCLRYSGYIHGLPNHLSVHSSGIIITERPIQYFGATSLPPKGFPTAHFDMHIAEDVGIYKYDILGQRGLGKIKDTISIIKQNQPDAPPFDIDDIPRFKKDEKIKDLLRRGDAIGCFYVESPAMRGLMRKLEVDDYKGLVAASSIIRPGVSNSGMMQEYIKRHRTQAARAATHPVLGEILGETYGVMVYQEDVLKVAHYFAKLTLEESDILRRGMSWKFRERTEFSQVEKKFYENCRREGYSEELTREIWKQIESFANYAFAKGHSASYAVESYQSLFLKAYYPLEYMVATVNNGGGFYRTEQYLQEARLKGGKIELPCVNRGDNITTIYEDTIYIGFQHVKELEREIVANLLMEREQGGEYLSLSDFVYRTGCSLEMLIIFIRIGAFRYTGKSKSWLLWKAHFLLGKQKKVSVHASLFKEYQPNNNVEIPQLNPIAYEDALDEMEFLGFPMCSPFDLIDEEYLQHETVYADFATRIGEELTIIGYLVHTKRTLTKGKKEQEMAFGTFMDRAGQFFDSVHFPQVYSQYSFRGRACYLLRGKVTSQFDYLSLETSYMKRLEYGKLV